MKDVVKCLAVVTYVLFFVDIEAHNGVVISGKFNLLTTLVYPLCVLYVAVYGASFLESPLNRRQLRNTYVLLGRSCGIKNSNRTFDTGRTRTYAG